MFPTTEHAANANNQSSFVHESGGASAMHDPLLSLASHAIRTCFSEPVQLICDTLQVRGPLTFSQLDQQLRLLRNKSQIPTIEKIRGSLLLLLQHSLVVAEIYPNHHLYYIYKPKAAVCLLRYPRLLLHIKRQLDDNCSLMLQELLLSGRLRTVDWCVAGCDKVSTPKKKKTTQRQVALQCMKTLVSLRYVEVAPVIGRNFYDDDDHSEAELFDPPPSRKRAKIRDDDDEDPNVVIFLDQYPELPVHTVWRVNLQTLHDSVRCHYLARLVGDRHRRIPCAGNIVLDALKYIATQQQRSLADNLQEYKCTVAELAQHLKKDTVQALVKSPGGDVEANLNQALRQLCLCTNPPVVDRCDSDMYTIRVSSLVDYLRKRIFYQIVKDRHGNVAARVVSILQDGYLESDKLAEKAMIPAKDTREILHHLYRSRYVNMMSLNPSKHYSASQALYLWGVESRTVLQTVREHVATALWRIRLRRDHEASVGKTWVERLQSDKEENDLETDKKNYDKFCKGLDRLDKSAYQLDETLMVLSDF